MPPYLLRFYVNGEVHREWPSMTVPLVPRKGEKVLGRVDSYSVDDVEYEYLLPDGCIIHVHLEKFE